MTRRKKAETQTRVDEFLPLLQKSILTLQDERTEALRTVETLKKRVEVIDGELAIMEAERDHRALRAEALPPTGAQVPTFPPEDAPLTQEEESVPSEDFYDNSTFCRPGQTLFMPVPGISAPVKTTAYKKATFYVVRAWVMLNRKEYAEEWFKSGLVVQDTGFSKSVVLKRLTELVEMGMLEHAGNRASSKYRYLKATGGNPTHRPRHDRPTTRAGGSPVAHTRKVGPSGKPGKDKRRQANGARIKRHRQGS